MPTVIIIWRSCSVVSHANGWIYVFGSSAWEYGGAWAGISTFFAKRTAGRISASGQSGDKRENALILLHFWNDKGVDSSHPMSIIWTKRTGWQVPDQTSDLVLPPVNLEGTSLYQEMVAKTMTRYLMSVGEVNINNDQDLSITRVLPVKNLTWQFLLYRRLWRFRPGHRKK